MHVAVVIGLFLFSGMPQKKNWLKARDNPVRGHTRKRSRKYHQGLCKYTQRVKIYIGPLLKYRCIRSRKNKLQISIALPSQLLGIVNLRIVFIVLTWYIIMCTATTMVGSVNVDFNMQYFFIQLTASVLKILMIFKGNFSRFSHLYFDIFW